MINRLKTLYQLQMIDDQLDQLEELRGDLPLAVQGLEERINELQRIITTREQEKQECLDKRTNNESEIELKQENQKKFKAQLYAVRNNKEYDALTKEIDNTDVQITKMELENDSLADQSKKIQTEIDELTPMLEELQKELKEKEADLKVIIKANEREEAKLKAEREKIEPQIRKPDYAAYIKIRKAKRGVAVATIKRSACSGCNNVVPSQRQLEIRRNNKLFYCEYCGRILVSAEIAELTH
ncbi:MAG TPA: C4-type zinc ribbon domain-containing protein [Ignavibacteriaceae bacterium]|nr:C4-type zinc ribbon domain-containing protein [Ignavibacteriaceae bacterium]